MRKQLFAILLGLSLVFGGTAIAQRQPHKAAAPPAHNVSAKRHPNLAAAQKALGVAFEKIIAAQKANEYDLAGHAAKAKDLIDQAATELKQAAEQSNDNKAK